ncbi:hypothetical protein [Maridesulfovibrio sp.]|uniref:hypothetical protein n=1 Tax=unclassified Maridesulfovibrio TaxID=2794999 RepID=UPI003B00249C
MKQVLIISNSNTLSSLLVKLLHEKYHVLVAENDYSSIVLTISDVRPDVVVFECKTYSDVKDNISKIRSKFISANIVLISSYLDSADREEIKDDNNVDQIIVKPCSRKSILAAVQSSPQRKKRNIDQKLLHLIVELYGSKSILFQRSYSRISNYLQRMNSHIDYDLDYVHDLLAYYLSIMTTMDDTLTMDLLSGNHTKKEATPSLIKQIDKMEEMAGFVMVEIDTKPLREMKYINKRYNGKGLPSDDVKETEIPYASRLLRVLFDAHYLEEKGKSLGECIFILNSRKDWYDRDILSVFKDSLGDEASYYNREVFPLGLQRDMIMAQDLYGVIKGKKVLLIKQGQSLTEKNIDFIHRHAHDILDVTEPVLIRESVLLCEDDDA